MGVKCTTSNEREATKCLRITSFSYYSYRACGNIQLLMIILCCTIEMMPPSRAYAKNANSRNSNRAIPFLDKEVLNAKFYNAI